MSTTSRLPLDLLPTRSVDPSVINILAKIEQINTDSYERSLISKGEIEHIYAKLLAFEMKRFLALPILEPSRPEPLVPSRKIDYMWHAFILDTPKYRAFCSDVYGRYLDHIPEEEPSISIAKVSGERFASTKRLYEGWFGAYPAEIWGPYAACNHGNCRQLCHEWGDD